MLPPIPTVPKLLKDFPPLTRDVVDTDIIPISPGNADSKSYKVGINDISTYINGTLNETRSVVEGIISWFHIPPLAEVFPIFQRVVISPYNEYENASKRFIVADNIPATSFFRFDLVMSVRTVSFAAGNWVTFGARCQNSGMQRTVLYPVISVYPYWFTINLSFILEVTPGEVVTPYLYTNVSAMDIVGPIGSVIPMNSLTVTRLGRV